MQLHERFAARRVILPPQGEDALVILELVVDAKERDVMIGDNLKRALTEQIEPHQVPVLSLYLDVNPANPANTLKAFVLRAAEAMRGLGLEKGYINTVTEKLSQEFAISKGRTLVLFVGQDPKELFYHYYLQTRLPLLERTDGALAHWGEPFIAPLLFVLDQRERYAAIYASSEHVRVFEVFLGQIDEMIDFVRVVDTDSWQPYREARRSPATGMGVAARGGADVERYRDRMEEATARLYRSLMPELEKILREGDIDRMILLGTPQALSALQEVMNPQLRSRVVAQLPPPSNPKAAAHEWLPQLLPVVDRVEAEGELRMLERVRESGMWGVQETLTLLQEHRLRTIFVPWTTELMVFRTESGRVAVTAAEATVLNPDETVAEVSLLEVLPELAKQSGAVIEFVDGEAAELLEKEFAGMAGLPHA